tara:strand:- start:650 stop:1420 length:771 start_codon:yes stop_codon:yes gene_type:complete
MLDEKVIVITGGAGFIGKELVKAVAEQNGVAIIADTNKDLGEKLKAELLLASDTLKLDFVYMDITSKGSLFESIKYLHQKYNRIDALVNNAYPRNQKYGKHFFNVNYNDFVENLGMNLGGCFLTSQQFAKYFKNQGYGNIINISSIYGIVAPKFEIYEKTEMTMPVEYAAIKAGLLHLTKYMAKYFKGDNIKVNAISPGGILDNQPIEFLEKYNKLCITKGMLDAKDLIGSLLFLLSDMSNYLNGQNIVVDDGFSL